MEETLIKSARKTALSSAQSAIGKCMSLEEFLRHDPEIPGTKLEWNDGEIEIEYTMKIAERKIIDTIVRQFNRLPTYQEGNSLLPEADVNLPIIRTYRRPDASYLTKQQIEDPENAPAAPAFLIEVISPANAAGDVDKKLDEYFRAGVQTVWIVYPHTQRVYVYTGPKSVQICSDDDVCSAAPAVIGLQLTANEIFR